jgi:hypothetical protein
VIVDQIQKRFHEAFHPFILQSSSGKDYRVPHPDLIAVHPKIVVVIDEGGVLHTISPLHVVAMSESQPSE